MYSIIVVLLLSWSPAVNLGIPGANDMHPQAVRWQAQHTCLVWESNVDGDWEIFSRFMIPNLPLYTDTIRITNNTTHDFFPVVAYDETRQCFWCAWMGTDSIFSDIFVSYGDSVNGWSIPDQVTNDAYSDHEPSVCVIHDTVWVAWYSSAGPVFNIYAAFYNGSSWTSPMPVTNDTLVGNTQPKINSHYDHPMIVWERNDDIYYSEYISGTWQSPLPVTTDPASDMKPEMAVERYPFGGGVGGSWIFWYSARDGNCEIYSTALDTFNVNHRITFNDSTDYWPSPLDFIAVIDRQQYPAAVAFVTTRRGNFDIYSYLGWFTWDTIPVDVNPSLDLEPCMSGGDWRVWIFWTTDRNGDWDICGSQMWVGGIEEGSGRTADGGGSILRAYPNPFSERTTIKCQIPNTKLQMNANPPHSMADQTTLAIYDAAGRMVKRFSLPTTYYLLPTAVEWDCTDNFGNPLAPGIYFCRLQQRDQVSASKLIKIK